jgi:hypothetical protein
MKNISYKMQTKRTFETRENFNFLKPVFYFKIKIYLLLLHTRTVHHAIFDSKTFKKE